MTEKENSLPYKIASSELKRFLDRISYPILKQFIKSPFFTSVRLFPISEPDEQKEILQIWYTLSISEAPDKEKWNELTDIFYGYNSEFTEMQDTNLTPSARDHLNLMQIEGFSSWDFNTFELMQSASYGISKEIQEDAPKALQTNFIFEEIGDDEFQKFDHEEKIKYLISKFANINQIKNINYKLIDNKDTIFSLLNQNDQLSTKLIFYILNFFSLPNEDEFNPLSKNFKPNQNFAYRDSRKLIIFVQDIIDYFLGMYGIEKKKYDENKNLENNVHQTIIDFTNFKENDFLLIKKLIVKFLDSFDIKGIDPTKIELTDYLIMLSNNNLKIFKSIKKSFMMHFNELESFGGPDTDFENTSNPNIQSMIEFVERILEDPDSSYNNENDLNPVKSLIIKDPKNLNHIKEVLTEYGYGLQYLDNQIKEDKNFITDICKELNSLEGISEAFSNDKEIMRESIKKNFRNIEFLGVNLKNNKKFIYEQIDTHIQQQENENFPNYDFWILDRLDNSIRNDGKIVLRMLEYDEFLSGYAIGDELKKNKDFLLSALKTIAGPNLISSLIEELEKHPDCLKKAKELDPGFFDL